MVKHARLATEFFPDFSGHTLDDGRYKLISLIGSGSYGKVYKAIDVTLPQDNQYVAIKCLEQPPPGSRQELFQTREFASHSKVGSHTNIVTFRGFFFAGEFVFVVLDLCDGGDLFTLLEKKPTFFRNSDHRVRNTMVQLIDAVEHCHKLDVFHRDLKPENILIAQDGHLYLADFGLCTNSPVSVDFGCGSSFYMSPECIGKEYKHSRFSTSHADIWALGIILANLLTQRNPWRHAMTTDSCFSAF
ncbi:kinase-like domain-containing protein, partial [Mycena floridula]